MLNVTYTAKNENIQFIASPSHGEDMPKMESEV